MRGDVAKWVFGEARRKSRVHYMWFAKRLWKISLIKITTTFPSLSFIAKNKTKFEKNINVILSLLFFQNIVIINSTSCLLEPIRQMKTFQLSFLVYFTHKKFRFKNYYILIITFVEYWYFSLFYIYMFI